MPHVYLDTDMEWSPYGTGFFSQNSAITLKDDKQNRIYLQYRYSQDDDDDDDVNDDETESIYTSVNLGLTPSLRAFLAYERDLYEDEAIETSTGVELNRSCWSMKISYTNSSDDQSIGFLINLKSLGEFGNQ